MRARRLWIFVWSAPALILGALAAGTTARADLTEAAIARVAAGRTSDNSDFQHGRQNARIVFVTGVVDAIDKNFFGRPQKVAIVSLSDSGALLQNVIEDTAAGQELKHHV